MPIATLSRWTMSFFAAALAFLLAGEAMMALGLGHPSEPLAGPWTLILVHVVAVGWLSLVMTGALYQFVPVLVSRPLEQERLAAPSLVLLVLGLLSLCLGFSAFAGLSVPDPALTLPLGAAALTAGFALALAALGLTLWRARPLGLFARFVAGGLAALALTAATGAVFAGLLSGLLSPLVWLLPEGVPVHAFLGLAGWMSFTAFGVSYKLLAMFMMAPEQDGARARAILAAGALGLLAGALALPLILAGAEAVALPVALGLFGLTVLLYIGDIAILFRARRRPALELNMRASVAAFAALAASVPLLLLAARPGAAEGAVAAVTHLFVFGWLTTLTLAQLLKIVSFLTWIEVYGPVIGRAPVPRVQDLVDERRAGRWFALYLIGAAAGPVALLAGAALPFRVTAALMLAGTLGIAWELIRIRRLAALSPATRLPPGTTLPPLFLPGTVKRTVADARPSPLARP